MILEGWTTAWTEFPCQFLTMGRDVWVPTLNRRAQERDLLQPYTPKPKAHPSSGLQVLPRDALLR